MSNKCHVQQPYYSNSLAIRQEIQRFESVHPSIYAIYDLLELIPDPLLAQQIREHVVCIEDSFVNSQEWTLSRSVPDLRLGIVGSLSSGKSALVHRYLTGSYMQDESPEGGRFKKEVVIEGQSYLLLIRDEGGTPELQFSCWVDAVIFVFSLENEPSFNAICNYYTKMSHYRNAAEVPLVLVGTQDAISESNPRVIDDSRARKLASDLKRCSYYETCATYGLNVERVFQDACHKIVQQKIQGLTPNSSRPGTPINHPVRCNYYIPGSVPLSNNHIIAQSNGYTNHPAATPTIPNSSQMVGSVSYSHAYHGQNFMKDAHQWEREMKSDVNGTNMLKESKSDKIERSFIVDSQQISNTVNKESKDIPTPCSTPTTSRKSRRRSNLFTPLKKDDDKKLKNGEVGSGRYIPLRQGYLYKRSCKTLNKEWKKKYVTLTNDARLTYHPSLHDYMDDIHGKEIPLMHTTVKIPGQKPRGSRTQGTISVQHINELASDISSLSLASNSDGYEFIIVSLDNKQWHFEATSTDDREAWVSAIEQQILNSLQGNESSKSKTRLNNLVDTASIQAIRTSIPGNTNCADCDAPNPDWASLNIGALLCIECSGTHRNLGSHISRIRSLDLDEWPPEHISVMMSLGNTIANSIWEGNIRGRAKPTPNSSREEKERWIRSKYELKEFLASTNSSMTIGQQLIDSVCKSDIKSVALVLAHVTSPDQVNVPVSPRDMRLPLHLAAALGNLAICQLLIWYNANVKAIDSDGRSPMVYAKNAGSQEIQDLLRNNGCPDTVVHTSNTMPKRRGSLSQKSSEVFDKLPASII
ncbi:centaurin-gamma-1A-like isoform X4 [Centruroides sculpturatus]|uniref:centaurin-gamma-1A-like isoform X4 n=1 Tax=Centruroides sculpturatus TaxID=218467 RepID=UPI000C6CF965|nr:centaurin-gamma-1A-like isoform X4 [Centruroides sculpturatus]